MWTKGAARAKEVMGGLARGHREYLVAVRGPGQFVGEMAAFASAALRCASVRARGPVRAKVIPGELLRATVERVPEVGRACWRVCATLLVAKRACGVGTHPCDLLASLITTFL